MYCTGVECIYNFPAGFLCEISIEEIPSCFHHRYECINTCDGTALILNVYLWHFVKIFVYVLFSSNITGDICIPYNICSCWCNTYFDSRENFCICFIVKYSPCAAGIAANYHSIYSAGNFWGMAQQASLLPPLLARIRFLK